MFRSTPGRRRFARWPVDGGESAKSLQRRGIERLLELVDCKKVQAVIIAKLDRLTRLRKMFVRRSHLLMTRFAFGHVLLLNSWLTWQQPATSGNQAALTHPETGRWITHVVLFAHMKNMMVGDLQNLQDSCLPLYRALHGRGREMVPADHSDFPALAIREVIADNTVRERLLYVESWSSLCLAAKHFPVAKELAHPPAPSGARISYGPSRVAGANAILATIIPSEIGAFDRAA